MISLIELYVKKLEQELNKESNLNKRMILWDKIKSNNKILNYSIKEKNDEFNSKIICDLILKDKFLFNSSAYIELVNKIYNNEILARIDINKNNDTFLMLTLRNKSLKLSKNKKLFLINEANNSPFTMKYYNENKMNIELIHGAGALDLRYKIITNKNFSLQEKKNLFTFFYPNNELKFQVLEELEWELMCELNIKNLVDDNKETIYSFTSLDLSNILHNKNKENEILNKINLCKFIRKLIPENEIKRFKNNE